MILNSVTKKSLNYSHPRKVYKVWKKKVSPTMTIIREPWTKKRAEEFEAKVRLAKKKGMYIL